MGYCHDMNFLLRVLKMLPHRWRFFIIFGCLFLEKPEQSFCLFLLNHLFILKIFPVTFFRKLVPAVRKPPVFLKFFRKPARTFTGENWPMTAKESRNIISEVTFGTIFRISNCFKEARRDLIIIFLFHKAAWKFKNHLRLHRKFWYNFIGFQKTSGL